MQLAGVEGEQVVLLLEDHQFVQPTFLELINSLLSAGEVPGLYTPEELEPLLTSLREQMSESGFRGTMASYYASRKQFPHSSFLPSFPSFFPSSFTPPPLPPLSCFLSSLFLPYSLLPSISQSFSVSPSFLSTLSFHFLNLSPSSPSFPPSLSYLYPPSLHSTLSSFNSYISISCRFLSASSPSVIPNIFSNFIFENFEFSFIQFLKLSKPLAMIIQTISFGKKL